MMVMDTATGKILEVNASYGARLCEHGKAVLIPKNLEASPSLSPAPAPAAKKGSRKVVTTDAAD